MAKNNDRYIRFYTPGTAAVKVAVQDSRHGRLFRSRSRKRRSLSMWILWQPSVLWWRYAC